MGYSIRPALAKNFSRTQHEFPCLVINGG
uniref:Uncharacterized protein n=1 Tax=Nymphaea colorata TaxID=210225 RepID=A0A5K1DXS0_9MAGN